MWRGTHIYARGSGTPFPNDRYIPPEGYGRKPVTYVSLEDARAYCKAAGKRLPHAWEWSLAGGQANGHSVPGNGDMARSVAGTQIQGPEDVDAHPKGASSFGVQDLIGNVWQFTDEFQDDHTRAVIVRGGSNYRPASEDKGWTSHWYVEITVYL